MAVVRLARMDELVSVGELATTLSQGGIVAASPGQRVILVRELARNEAADSSKKNGSVTADGGLNRVGEKGSIPTLLLSQSSLQEIWRGSINTSVRKLRSSQVISK